MEEQLQRANQSNQVVKIANDREALDHLLEEGLSNFECRISLESSKNITDIRASGMFLPLFTCTTNFYQFRHWIRRESITSPLTQTGKSQPSAISSREESLSLFRQSKRQLLWSIKLSRDSTWRSQFSTRLVLRPC